MHYVDVKKREEVLDDLNLVLPELLSLLRSCACHLRVSSILVSLIILTKYSNSTLVQIITVYLMISSEKNYVGAVCKYFMLAHKNHIRHWVNG